VPTIDATTETQTFAGTTTNDYELAISGQAGSRRRVIVQNASANATVDALLTLRWLKPGSTQPGPAEAGETLAGPLVSVVTHNGGIRMIYSGDGECWVKRSGTVNVTMTVRASPIDFARAL